MPTHSVCPLAGRTIVLTRTAERNEETRPVLESYGATVLCFPTIEILDPPSWQPVDNAIWKLAEYTDICFTSYHGIKKFIERIRTIRPKALETLSTRTLLAIGEKARCTLESLGFPLLSMMTYPSVKEFIESLKMQPLTGRKFLHPTGSNTSNDIWMYLNSRGVHYDELSVYRSVVPAGIDIEDFRTKLSMKTIDAITFFSPSAVLNFIDILGAESLSTVAVAAVSNITAEALLQAGIQPSIVAHPPTAEGLCTSLAKYFQ